VQLRCTPTNEHHHERKESETQREPEHAPQEKIEGRAGFGRVITASHGHFHGEALRNAIADDTKRIQQTTASTPKPANSTGEEEKARAK